VFLIHWFGIRHSGPVQIHRPPAAIGSSTNGDTGGGKKLFIAAKWLALPGPGLRQSPDLRVLRLDQSQLQFFDASFQHDRRAQHRELVARLFVLGLQLGQPDFARFDLTAQFVNLALLPHVAHADPPMSAHNKNALSAGPPTAAIDICDSSSNLFHP
jgi:hypothetical protein